MTSLPTPPKPPQSVLSTQEQIATFTQMLKSLEESAQYQESAIAYHTESLKLLKEELINTNSQLDLCRNTIATLTKTKKLVSSRSSKNGENGYEDPKVLEKKAAEEKKLKPEVKSKSTKTSSKKKQDSQLKSEKKTTSKQTINKGRKKTRSNIPSSSILDKYENITAMVLDFVQKQEGVVDVSQIIKYVYPQGLSKEERKKAVSSFSSVLSLGKKKGILGRTVPGKYLWTGK